MSLPSIKLNLAPPTCNDALPRETWMSMFHFPTLTVADELGLFSLLHEVPAVASDVAKKLDLGARATEALLGLMTSLGYLVQQDEKFSLTEVSRNFMLPESPYYWGGMLKFMANNPITHSVLLASLRDDKSSVYEAKEIWETHELEAEKAKLFTSAMHSHSIATAFSAVKQGDFASVKRLLDVGGGSGAFCIALAQKYPQIYSTILELPIICSIAEDYIAADGLSERIDTRAGNFFQDSFPDDYDAILFSNVFHDWNWQKCLYLAKRSFEALPQGGRIFLHEILLSETKDSPIVATSMSMCMIWATEGKQYTASELHQILTEAGFEEILVIPTDAYYSLITARKP
jgi:cyclopropane fatty-acyl-phospholipid synthase-like methyltransferase